MSDLAYGLLLMAVGQTLLCGTVAYIFLPLIANELKKLREARKALKNLDEGRRTQRSSN